MPVVVRRECLACAKRYDWTMWQDGTALSLDNDDDEDLSCPSCGSEERKKVVAVGRRIYGEKFYPYFDRSLQMTLDSKSHHDRVMREKGIHHCSVEDIERRCDAMRAEKVKDDLEDADYDRYVEDSEEMRGYRKLRAKGAFVQDVPANQRAKAQNYLMRNDRR